MQTVKQIRALTPGEIASQYRVSKKTMSSWLKPFVSKVGPRLAKYYTIRQVKQIYKCLGSPVTMFEE